MKQTLRLLLISFVAGLAHLVGAETIRVDGVPVFGKIHEVTRADIHAAITDCDDKPAAVEVVGKTEIRAHLRQRELGYIPKCPIKIADPDGGWHPGWGFCGRFGIADDPEGLRLIRRADEVYVFPVMFTSIASSRFRKAYSRNPHGDYRRSRLLGQEAQQALARLLGHEKKWHHGFDHRIGIGPEPRNVGFSFRRGRDELVLFCSQGAVLDGRLNGQNTGGSLAQKSMQELEEWKKQYAQPELAAR